MQIISRKKQLLQLCLEDATDLYHGQSNAI